MESISPESEIPAEADNSHRKRKILLIILFIVLAAILLTVLAFWLSSRDGLPSKNVNIKYLPNYTYSSPYGQQLNSLSPDNRWITFSDNSTLTVYDLNSNKSFSFDAPVGNESMTDESVLQDQGIGNTTWSSDSRYNFFDTTPFYKEQLKEQLKDGGSIRIYQPFAIDFKNENSPRLIADETSLQLIRSDKTINWQPAFISGNLLSNYHSNVIFTAELERLAQIAPKIFDSEWDGNYTGNPMGGNGPLWSNYYATTFNSDRKTVVLTQGNSIDGPSRDQNIDLYNLSKGTMTRYVGYPKKGSFLRGYFNIFDATISPNNEFLVYQVENDINDLLGIKPQWFILNINQTDAKPIHLNNLSMSDSSGMHSSFSYTWSKDSKFLYGFVDGKLSKIDLPEKQ